VRVDEPPFQGEYCQLVEWPPGLTGEIQQSLMNGGWDVFSALSLRFLEMQRHGMVNFHGLKKRLRRRLLQGGWQLVPSRKDRLKIGIEGRQRILWSCFASS
jgi:hypothetical protein